MATDFILEESCNYNYNYQTKMASKWNDDFQFDDIDDQPQKKKTQVKKGAAKEDDFFDLDEIEDAPKNKLPVINDKRNSGKNLLQLHDKNTRNNQPLTEKINQRNLNKHSGIENDEFEQELPRVKDKPKKADQNQSANINVGKNNNLLTSNKGKQSDEEEEFFEEIEDVKFEKQAPGKQQVIQTNGKSEQPEEDNYQQQFDEDNYGEDFQEVEQKKPVNKVQRSAPVGRKSVEIPPSNKLAKPPINVKPTSRKRSIDRTADAQKPARNVSLNRPAIQRSESRKSLQSAVSRGKSTNTFVPNKYVTLVDKNFPQNFDANKENQDRISKVNDKIRNMIRSFNDELNDLINKNMLHLKAKKSEKTTTVEERIKVLEEEIKNNETTIYRMEGEFDKLRGRQGELKEEEYQLVIQRNIIEAKEKIKEAQKDIQQLKVGVNNSGNKLTKNTSDKKVVQDLQTIKANLIQAKRDDEKGVQAIQKLDQKTQQLSDKIAELDNRIRDKVQAARSKGIQVRNMGQVYKKYDELKKKLETSKHYRIKMQNLMKTKADIVDHQKQQLKIAISNAESQIKNLYSSISHSHNQSVKVVQKARENPKVQGSVHDNLEQILRSLEQSVNDEHEARSQVSRAESHRPFKKGPSSAAGNRQKSTPGKIGKKNISKPPLSHQNIDAEQKQPNTKKPNFTRRKNNDSFDEKNEERVWKQEKQTVKQVKKQNHEPSIAITEEKKEQDKKKPFSLKKSKLNSEPKTSTELLPPEDRKEEKSKQEEPAKSKQETSVAGPRMMKFKRKNQQESSKQIPSNDKPIEQKESFKIAERMQETQEQSNAVIAPKRFNIRNRNKDEKKEDSYMPSTVEKKETQPPKKQEEYKPNFNFKQEEFKAVDNKKQELKIGGLNANEESSTSKPMFNLRLKDRKKTNEPDNSEGGYMPSIASNKNIQKEAYKKEQENQPGRVRNNVNNPYGVERDSNGNIGAKELNLYGEKEEQNKRYAPKKEQANKPYAPASNLPKKQQQFKNPYALPKEEVTNPYAPSTDNQPVRQREGKIRKQKLAGNVPKQKFNIYEQAEDLTGGNQFVSNNKNQNAPSVPLLNPVNENKREEHLDLNAMLGLNKKKQNNDFDDLVTGTNKMDQKKDKKRADDFFGDIDI